MRVSRAKVKWLDRASSGILLSTGGERIFALGRALGGETHELGNSIRARSRLLVGVTAFSRPQIVHRVNRYCTAWRRNDDCSYGDPTFDDSILQGMKWLLFYGSSRLRLCASAPVYQLAGQDGLCAIGGRSSDLGSRSFALGGQRLGAVGDTEVLETTGTEVVNLHISPPSPTTRPRRSPIRARRPCSASRPTCS